MQYIKKFEQYTPEEKPFGESAIYLIGDNGQDWYSIQASFNEDSMKVVFDEDGLVVACSRDVSSLFPLNCGVLEIDSQQTDLIGMYVVDGVLTNSIKPSELHQWDGGKWVVPSDRAAEFLSSRKNQLLRLIADKVDGFISSYLVSYSESEIKSFYRQEQEARNEIPLMLLTEIFEGRSDDFKTMEDLKKKVIEKADLLAIITGKLFVIKQNFEKRIEGSGTEGELSEIEKEINQWEKL